MSHECVGVERRIMNLDDSVGDVGGWGDGVGGNHPVRVFFADLRDKQVPIPEPVPPPRERIWNHRNRLCRKFFTIAGNTHLGGTQCPQPPSSRHQALGRRALHPRYSLRGTCRLVSDSVELEVGMYARPLAQLLPAPLWSKTKLSGRKRESRGPKRSESMVRARDQPAADWGGARSSVVAIAHQFGYRTAK